METNEGDHANEDSRGAGTEPKPATARTPHRLRDGHSAPEALPPGFSLPGPAVAGICSAHKYSLLLDGPLDRKANGENPILNVRARLDARKSVFVLGRYCEPAFGSAKAQTSSEYRTEIVGAKIRHTRRSTVDLGATFAQGARSACHGEPASRAKSERWPAKSEERCVIRRIKIKTRQDRRLDVIDVDSSPVISARFDALPAFHAKSGAQLQTPAVAQRREIISPEGGASATRNIGE